VSTVVNPIAAPSARSRNRVPVPTKKPAKIAPQLARSRRPGLSITAALVRLRDRGDSAPFVMKNSPSGMVVNRKYLSRWGK
jgi:hypothetical protein